MDVLAKLKELNIYPNKSLGQNFLKNDSLADFIVESIDPRPEDIFLEVGPGLGILTMRLLDAGSRVVAVEKDPAVAYGLERIFEQDLGRLEIINGDILDQELDKFSYNKVISNLPFQISSPFTFKFLRSKFEKAVITYQLEFARRLTARTGGTDYSRLTVMSYTRAEIKMLKRIKAGSFHPSPKVDAAVVEFLPRAEPAFPITDESFFADMIRELFNHRRKKIRTSLKGAHRILGKGVDKDEYKAAVLDIPWGDNRPEELTPEELGELANKLLDSIQ